MSNNIMKTTTDFMKLAAISLLMAACASPDKTTPNNEPLPTPTKPKPVRIAREYDRAVYTPGNGNMLAGIALSGDNLPFEQYVYAPATATEKMSIANGRSVATQLDIIPQPGNMPGINSVFDADAGDSIIVTHSSGDITKPDTVFATYPSSQAIHQFRGRLSYSDANLYAYAANGKLWQRSSTIPDTLVLPPVKPAPVRLRQEYRNMMVSPAGNGDVNTVSFMMADNKSKTLQTSALGDSRLKVFNSNYFISQTDTVPKSLRPADLPTNFTAFYATRDDSLLLNRPSGKITTPDTLFSMYPMTNAQHWFTTPVTGIKAATLMKSADNRTYKVY